MTGLKPTTYKQARNSHELIYKGEKSRLMSHVGRQTVDSTTHRVNNHSILDNL